MYDILYGTDGVFERSLLIKPAETMEVAKELLVFLHEEYGYDYDEMAIADKRTGRLVSYILEV